MRRRYTITEAAGYLGISHWTLRHWITEGRAPVIRDRISNRPYIPESWLEEQLEPLWEMANISRRKTGLPYVIWVSTRMGEGGKMLPHGPRIKIPINGKRYPLTIENDPRLTEDTPISISDLNQIKEWVIEKQIPLMAYWNEEITTDELFDHLDG